MRVESVRIDNGGDSVCGIVKTVHKFEAKSDCESKTEQYEGPCRPQMNLRKVGN
jgi:hypothetical protein